jgi:hypothetical protein
MKEAPVQIKNRQQLLMIVTGVAAALFLGDRVIVSTLTSKWDARAKRIESLRSENSRNALLLKREAGIRQQWADWQSRTLTNDASMAEQQVSQSIERWARETGVVIAAITPQWKHDSDDYQTYGCRIDAKGDLQRLTQFLYRAEREPMALKIEAIELAAADKEGQQLSLGLQFSALILTPSSQ